MAVNLSPIWGAGAQLLDNSGNVLSGGKIYTYAAGTTTQVATYTSNSGVTANSNPIVLNSAGRVPYEIWLTDGQNYKFVLKDSNDVLIGTWDNLSGINSNFVAYTNQQEIQTATAGQTVFNLTTMQYLPGTGNLSVFVDGVNQYGPGAQYAFVETDQTTVTFASGLHVGASVKFTSTQIENAGVADASQISYTYPDTDAVTQNVEARLAQYVSVKDFGAVGDGVTDDTDAIQNAIDSVKCIYFPEGTYKVTELNLQDGSSLTGSGENSIIVQDSADSWSWSEFATSGHGVFKSEYGNISICDMQIIPQFEAVSVNPVSVVENVCLQNLFVNGLQNTKATTATQATAIYVKNATNVLITNCIIDGTGTAGSWNGSATISGFGGGILLLSCDQSRIVSNRITSVGQNGINSNDSSNVVISNNNISKCYQSGIQLYPDGSGSQGYSITGNVISENCADGVDVNWIGAGIIPMHLTVSGNKFYRNGYFLGDVTKKGNDGSGIGTYRSISHFTVTSNESYDSRGAGCYLTNTNSFVISNNVITLVNDAGKEGMFIGSTSQDGVIQGNVVKTSSGNSLSIGGSQSLTNVNISGNSFVSETGESFVQGNTAVYDYVSIENNTFYGNGTIYLFSNGTSFNSNIVYSTESPVIQITTNGISISDCVIENNETSSVGIFAQNVTSISISKNYITASTGININGCDDCDIVNNYINSFSTALQTEEGGIVLYSNGSNYCDNTNIWLNYVSPVSGGNAILTNYPTNTFLNNNKFYGTTTYRGTVPKNATYS